MLCSCLGSGAERPRAVPGTSCGGAWPGTVLTGALAARAALAKHPSHLHRWPTKGRACREIGPSSGVVPAISCTGDVVLCVCFARWNKTALLWKPQTPGNLALHLAAQPGRDNGFCCYPLDTLLSPLCPQALTGAALTAASALSGDVPSLMMLLITSMARLAHYPDGHLGPRASLTTSVGSPPSGDPGLSTHLLSSDSPSPTGWPVLPPVFLSFSQHC